MIRWITPLLGTAPFGSDDVEAEMDVLDVRDLVDKEGNNVEAVRGKIEQGLRMLGEGHRVVVCCDYGISRSNSVAAGILARFSGMPFQAAVREVGRATGETEIKLEPLEAVRAALEQVAPVAEAQGRRLLVTGGGGFIGSALQGALEGAIFMVAPVRSDVDLTAGALALDLVVKEHRIDTIVHLANPRVYTSARAAGDAITMLRNVLDVCRAGKVRLIFLSGWEVYSGYRSSFLLADEHLPMLPKGPYGEAKMLCEVLINHYRRVHRLEATILRSSPVYGVGADRPKFIHNFVGKARTGDQIFTHDYRNGSPRLDLLHIRDLVSALVMVLKSEAGGDFNVGSGVLTSTRDVASDIVRKLASSSAILQRTIDDHAPNILMDYSRIRTELGWKPTTSIDAGLSEIITQGMM